MAWLGSTILMFSLHFWVLSSRSGLDPRGGGGGAPNVIKREETLRPLSEILYPPLEVIDSNANAYLSHINNKTVLSHFL